MDYLKQSLIGAGIGNFLYALYIQFAPGMGNTWLRMNVNNEYVFAPGNLFRLMVHPFFDPNMWKLSVLDINYLTWLGLGALGGAIYHYFTL